MTTDPQLLALLGQLREAAGHSASAGFAPGDPGRAAPLVTAQAGCPLRPCTCALLSSHTTPMRALLALFKFHCSKTCCTWWCAFCMDSR